MSNYSDDIMGFNIVNNNAGTDETEKEGMIRVNTPPPDMFPHDPRRYVSEPSMMEKKEPVIDEDGLNIFNDDEDDDFENDENDVESNHNPAPSSPIQTRTNWSQKPSSSYADINPQTNIREMKLKYLIYIKSYEKKYGSLGNYNYSMDDSLDTLRNQANILKKYKSQDSKKTFLETGIRLFTSGIEMINNNMDPFDIELKGWSQAIDDDIGDGVYDDIIDDLVEKYDEQLELAPEMRLGFALGISALVYHKTHIHLKKSGPSSSTKQPAWKPPPARKEPPKPNLIGFTPLPPRVNNNETKNPSLSLDPEEDEKRIDDILSRMNEDEKDGKRKPPKKSGRIVL